MPARNNVKQPGKSGLVRRRWAGAVWLVVVSGLMPPGRGAAQDPVRGADFSGVDRFWAIADQLSAGIEPSAAAWDSLFETPGYAALEQREGRRKALIEGFRVALMPGLEERRESIPEDGGTWAARVARHIVTLPGRRVALERLRERLIREDFLTGALGLAGTVLPPGTVEQFGPPGVAFVFFLPDGRGYPGLIVADLANIADKAELRGFFAHEAIHFYYSRLARERTTAPATQDVDEGAAAVLSLVTKLFEESLGDQFDKGPHLAMTPEEFAAAPMTGEWRAYLEEYRVHLDDAAVELCAVDAALSSAAVRGVAAMAATADSQAAALPLEGRPLGYFITRAIRDHLGDPRLAAAVGDPIEWLKAFRETGSDEFCGGPAFGAGWLHVLPGGNGGAGGPATAGTLIRRRRVATDTARSYAIFLPPGYDPGRSWPALVLMDPRGRALVPLERFLPGAAALGYVILSSYDTSSDEPASGEDTRLAVEGLLNDAANLLSLDLGRLHLVGFSGTARMAWAMAVGAEGNFPAIVGFGGGVHPGVLEPITAAEGTGPAFFGGAGTEDFNYAEMWQTDARLEQLGLRHALVYFPGGHGWPPAEIATEAVEWLEVTAQATALAALDTAWIRERFGAGRQAAIELERSGRAHDAMLRYRRLRDTFAPFDALLDGGPVDAGAAVTRLARQRGVRRTTDALDRWMADEQERSAAAVRMATVLAADPIPPIPRLAGLLDLGELRKRAAGTDTLRAQMANRVLAGYFVQASFYLPRQFLAAGDTARAVRALELAMRIAPGAPAGCARFRMLFPAWAGRSPDLSAACGNQP